MIRIAHLITLRLLQATADSLKTRPPSIHKSKAARSIPPPWVHRRLILAPTSTGGPFAEGKQRRNLNALRSHFCPYPPIALFSPIATYSNQSESMSHLFFFDAQVRKSVDIRRRLRANALDNLDAGLQQG